MAIRGNHKKIDEFKMTLLSRIEVQTRNYQSKPLQPTQVPNLNGNAILQGTVPANILRVVQTQAISFFKSMAEKIGSDIQRL